MSVDITNAITGAVGSGMFLKTFMSPILPASLVDERYTSVKYAGTVITADLFLAVSSKYLKTFAEISSGKDYFVLP